MLSDKTYELLDTVSRLKQELKQATKDLNESLKLDTDNKLSVLDPMIDSIHIYSGNGEHASIIEQIADDNKVTPRKDSDSHETGIYDFKIRGTECLIVAILDWRTRDGNSNTL